MVTDTVGAFCSHGWFELAAAPTGPQVGRTFAVKDLFDIAGRVTGAGNPQWLATHGIAEQTAPPVAALCAAGARMIGKTPTDELAYSLNGDNLHYSTTRNSKAPNRVPGGSSSGSAVAAVLCDFALGTDTGASVRIPASFCGLFGIRTTHGTMSIEGLVPLMPSFDTVGWFARDPELFEQIGPVLLLDAAPNPVPSRLLIVSDARKVLDPDAVPAFSNAVDRASSLFHQLESVSITVAEGLAAWRDVFRIVSAHETWRVHRDWISAHKGSLSAPIAERFAFAKSVSDADAVEARRSREELSTRVRALVHGGSVLCILTAPGPAPKLDATGETVEQFRQRGQRLTARHRRSCRSSRSDLA